jgi:TnpA family transposase
MTTISETAYPRFKSTFTEQELIRNFTPTGEEISLMSEHTYSTTAETRLGFIATLKCYQCLGRPITALKIPQPIITYLASTIKTDATSLSSYDQSLSRKRHIKIIRDHLQLSADETTRKKCMKKVAMQSAAIKGDLVDIINDILEELVKNCFELPVLGSILRLAKAARTVSNNYYYQKISDALSENTKKFIDALFYRQNSGENSSWHELKQDPKNPTSKHVKTFIAHLHRLQELKSHINISMDFIPTRRIEHFVSEAIALDASDMRKIKSQRRYCLAVLFILFKASSAIDDLVLIFIRWMRKLHTDAQESLKTYRINHFPETDNLVGLLHKILTEVKSPDYTAPEEKIMAIENCIMQGPDKAIDQCEEYMAYSGNNYFPFMLKPYSNKRSLIFELINQLHICSSSQDNSLIEAIEFIKKHRNSHKEKLTINEDDLDLKWLPEKWARIIIEKQKNNAIKIHRKYYELAVLSTLADELDCSDTYVEGANIYDDPNKQLITWEEFYKGLEEYCKLAKIPSNSENFIEHCQKELRDTAYKVDNAYSTNQYLHIENGKPIVKKHATIEAPEEVKKIGKLIAEHMPLTNIVEVITDVERWLDLSACFKPLSGFDTKIPDYKKRFAATSFAYGCNIGPTESERSLPGFTRKQIAWLFNKHVTEDKLEKVSTKVVNFYNMFELPKHWGTGNSISTDATYWDMYQQNTVAEYHIRFGDYGGLGYYHVSDLYIALYSNFIPCGVYEGNYIFDGVYANQSDIKPDQVHGDTGAQSEVIFGFAVLLGIKLMPRIRDFKHLRYYKASKDDKFTHIDSLFASENISWNLIKTHLYDMLRHVMSISSGRIKASTILRKLCSKSRKNKLYFAFRELGRVARTIFLLNYVNDVELRRTIHAATCKSEEFNDFIKWIRFGDGGTVADNMRYNQKKIIKYGHLVANMTMTHIMANMTMVVNALRKEGIEIADEYLKYFSPFRTEHMNRLGIFQLDFDRMLAKPEYELLKKEI